MKEWRAEGREEQKEEDSAVSPLNLVQASARNLTPGLDLPAVCGSFGSLLHEWETWVLVWPLLLPGCVATGSYTPFLNLTLPCQLELAQRLKGLPQGHRWALCECFGCHRHRIEGYYYYSL